jgi:uncharacterized protein
VSFPSLRVPSPGVSSLVLLRPGDYRVMPWRNGSGTTTEIAIHPPGAGLDEFLWRVSIAEIGGSGPFSTFAGYDRTLVQIEGAPLTLSHDGGPGHRLELLRPYRFAGEITTHCTLETPPARDLNVMVRRARASAEVSVHELDADATARAQTSVLHVLRGSLYVDTCGATMRASEGETLVAPERTTRTIRAGAGGVLAVAVAIEAPREDLALAAADLTPRSATSRTP